MDSTKNPYITVSQLTYYIKQKFDKDPYLDRVFIKGEVSNAGRNKNRKHFYFSLKDEHSLINAVMFAPNASKLAFELEEGMAVLATGRVSVYEKSGRYQIIIDEMQPDGVGALYLAYEQTKQRLSQAGYFDPHHKKSLKKYPNYIAVVTSQSGAVIRDIMTTIQRRFPKVAVHLYPTAVQGEKAIPDLIQNIKRADQRGLYDTMIVGRGGGSIEDLWAFNDEEVAKTIFQANTPIISSVGHETDTTLADYVADVRAATPTAAAELAVPVLSEELVRLDQTKNVLINQMNQLLKFYSQQLTHLNHSYVLKQPHRLYEGYIQNVDQLDYQLKSVINQYQQKYQTQVKDLVQGLCYLAPDQQIKEYTKTTHQLHQALIKVGKTLVVDKEKTLNHAIQSLNYLSPLQILGRGYSYATMDNQVVSKASQVKAGDHIELHLADGYLEAKVERTYQSSGKDADNG